MSQIPWLEDLHCKFPDVRTALTEPDGLLAASERLTAELVIEAYLRGIFPWYSEGQPVLWWSPNPRCVLYPKNFHLSRSFKRTLNKKTFSIRTNTVFKDVILACAAPRAQDSKSSNVENNNAENNHKENSGSGTWITDDMLNVYCQLHEAGVAHSIECWHNNELVGGMYGLILGDVFFGESMFSKRKDASKVAIHYVCTVIKPSLIDAQVHSCHLQSLGAKLIERQDFIEHIHTHLNLSIKI